MKNILVIFTILYFCSLKGQIIVEYKVELDTLIDLYQNKQYRIATGNVEQLDFVLKFDGKYANYYTKEILSSDNRYNISKAIAFAQANKFFYIDLEKGMYYYEPKDRFLSNVIVADSIDKNWIITKEIKKIGGFLCYKAIGKIYETKPDKAKPLEIKKKYIPVVAWFAPEINVPLGPKGFGNLPGLIMELQYAKFKIFVKKIDLNPKGEIEIRKIEGETLMSEADFIMKKVNLMIEKGKNMGMDFEKYKK